MSAWTVTALSGLLALLEGDSRLSIYVDTFEIQDRLRDDEVPDMTRHAIVLIPGAKTVAPSTPSTNLETLTVTVRLIARVWDPANPSEIVIADNVTGGVGASEVGMLQFAEDVSNALRKQEMSILEMSGVECDAMPSLMQVASSERDTVFYETTLTWTGQYKGYHDPTLRS